MAGSSPSFFQLFVEIYSRQLQRRHQTEKKAGQKRKSQRKTKRCGVELHLCHSRVCINEIFRQAGCDKLNHPMGKQQSSGANSRVAQMKLDATALGFTLGLS